MNTSSPKIQTQLTNSTPHISGATRELLRTLLEPLPLTKGEGEFEIGREVTKTSIRQSLEAQTGMKL